MRSLLHAVFKRGREVGLTMEAAEKALAPAVAVGRREDERPDATVNAGEKLPSDAKKNADSAT